MSKDPSEGYTVAFLQRKIGVEQVTSRAKAPRYKQSSHSRHSKKVICLDGDAKSPIIRP